MPLEQKIYSGKLNTDDSPYLLPKADYIDALNITRDAQGEGQDMVVSNVVGNRIVSYSLPTGTNKRIGSKEDLIRNRVYYFVWNSNNHDLILFYDKSAGTITKLIENITDTGGTDVLNFDPSWKINHVDIIYRDEGDLLFWTDGLNAPRKINVTHIINNIYSSVKSQFVEVAKRPPLVPPTCVYGSDTTRNSNSLRRKLFMFTYRWACDDFEKTTFSSYSKIPLPIGYYGSDNDIDSTKNNFITITVQTGDENVTDIEIAMRDNSGNDWEDFVLIASLNKAQLSIPDNTTYDFLFYNDQLYPPLDLAEVGELFDWVPRKAYTQCLPNGNVVDYGAITENYDNYPVDELNVTITVENKTNIPPDTDPPSITYTVTSSTTLVFSVNGNVPVGTRYQIYLNFQGNPGIGQTFGPRLVGDYTSIGGDTIDTVALALSNQFNAYPSVPSIAVSYPATGLNSWQASGFVPTITVTQIIVTPGTPAAGTISTEKVWMWDANYIFGQVYADEQNRDMPGVTSFVNPINSDNDYMVTTPSFSLDVSKNVQTPVITAQVNHLPKAGSKEFYWVRRRMTYGTFMMYETCDFQSDTDFLYFCLANIERYKAANSQFIYGTAPITSESRIKIIAGINSSAYTGDLWTQDYQILGLVPLVPSGGSPGDEVDFVKVKKPTGAISPAYTANMLVMIYTPALNPTSTADSVYFEWGEAYAIYEGHDISYSGRVGTFTVGETITGGTSGATAIVVADNNIGILAISDLSGTFTSSETITGGSSSATATYLSISAAADYHRGMTQDQTSFQPAIYVWTEGDVYFHDRTMFVSARVSVTGTDIVPLMDANWSDFFDSAVNDNGRAQVIDVNARETYYPTLDRFSEAYQQDTNINQTNRFFFSNQDTYDRSFGDIRKQFIEGRYKYVFQKFDIGVVPVLTQVVRDTSNNPLQANSDQLLNKIMYPYKGKVGIGDCPESFAQDKFAKYGVDNNKGVVWRLSQDGITILSVLYKTNAFFVANLPAFRKDLNNGIAPVGQTYTGDPAVYGCFDAYTNKYIVALEEINRYSDPSTLSFHQDATTLSFLETRDSTEGFESKLSYHPEGMVSIGTTLITFKDGALWKHDGASFSNFYGVQYEAYIKGVFNDKVNIKKTFHSVSYQGNQLWVSPTNGDITTSQPNPQTGLPQISQLKGVDFEIMEGLYYAALLRDANSGSVAGTALLEGDFLKGTYLIWKMGYTGSELATLLLPTVNYSISQRNF